MAAWGAGSFENDSALDWLGNLLESRDASLVRSALNCVVEHGGTKHYPPSIIGRLIGRRRRTDWLTAGTSSKALAAAEIVAAWLGQPPGYLPDGTTAWLQQHSPAFQSDLVPLARRAVEIVKTNSELKDLWYEGDSTDWRQAIEDLEL